MFGLKSKSRKLHTPLEKINCLYEKSCIKTGMWLLCVTQMYYFLLFYIRDLKFLWRIISKFLLSCVYQKAIQIYCPIERQPYYLLLRHWLNPIKSWRFKPLKQSLPRNIVNIISIKLATVVYIYLLTIQILKQDVVQRYSIWLAVMSWFNSVKNFKELQIYRSCIRARNGCCFLASLLHDGGVGFFRIRNPLNTNSY